MRRAWLIGMALAALLAGCGGGGTGDQQSAQDVAREYVQARNQGDAARVCELYSRRLIAQLKTSNCVAFVREQTSGAATNLAVIGVREQDDHATATIQARVGEVANAIAPIELQLTREGGGWKISGLGGPGG